MNLFSQGEQRSQHEGCEGTCPQVEWQQPYSQRLTAGGLLPEWLDYSLRRQFASASLQVSRSQHPDAYQHEEGL